MANFDNFSLMSQIAPRQAAPAPVATPAPAPQATPQQNMPFGFLSPLFERIGVNLPQSNPGLDLVGGLLGNLFGGSKKKETTPTKAVIDQRPADVQRLVSMFSNGGQ